MNQLNQFHKHVIISAIAAVVLHGLVLALWMSAIIFKFVNTTVTEKPTEPVEESEMTMVLLPESKLAEVIEPLKAEDFPA